MNAVQVVEEVKEVWNGISYTVTKAVIVKGENK